MANSTMNQEQFDLTKKLVKAQEEVERKYETTPGLAPRTHEDLQVYGGSETCRTILQFMDEYGLGFLHSPFLDVEVIMELHDIIFWATIDLPDFDDVVQDPNHIHNQIMGLIEPQLP